MRASIWIAALCTPALALASGGSYRGLGAVLLTVFIAGPLACLLLVLLIALLIMGSEGSIGRFGAFVVRAAPWIAALALPLQLLTWAVTEGVEEAYLSAAVGTVVLGALNFGIWRAAKKVRRRMDRTESV